MELKIGSVVVSKAGKDKNTMLAVVKIAEDGIYVCDGKDRPLENPKRKNPKHLAATHYALTAEETATNRSLKKALKTFSCIEESEVK